MITWTYVDPSTGRIVELDAAAVAGLESPVRYVWREGHLVRLTGGEALVDKIQCEFLFFLGEWFLNQKLGFPWKERVLIKNPDLNILDLLFRRMLRRLPWIDRVRSLSFRPEPATRTLFVSFEAVMRGGVTVAVAAEPYDLSRPLAA